MRKRYHFNNAKKNKSRKIIKGSEIIKEVSEDCAVGKDIRVESEYKRCKQNGTMVTREWLTEIFTTQPSDSEDESDLYKQKNKVANVPKQSLCLMKGETIIKSAQALSLEESKTGWEEVLSLQHRRKKKQRAEYRCDV